MRGVSRKTYNLVCNVCSLKFEAGRKDKKCCSRKCYKKYNEKNSSKLVSLTCLTCSIEFKRENWYVNKMKKREGRMFCSRGCASSYTNFHRNEKRILKCEGCKEEFLLNQSDAKDKYCSRKCYFDHQKEDLAIRARQLGKDSASKISETHKRRYQEDPTCHGFYGKHHSEDTKKKFSESKKEYYETHDGFWKDHQHSEESKQKMSETKTENWINGKYDHIKMSWAKGVHFFKKANKKVHYRSSWELGFMKYLDRNDDVVRCEYEGLRIPYYGTDNHLRNYIPDFLVEYGDSNKILYEIKPFLRKDSEINQRKFKAAREYCKERNIKFKVITEKYLKYIKAI